MIRKLVSIISVIAVIGSLFSVNVNAAYIYQQDFESVDETIMSSLISPDGDAWVREITDGVLRISNPADGAMSQSFLFDVTIDTEAVFQFDIKMDCSTGYMITNIYRGGERGRYAVQLDPDGLYSGREYNAPHNPGVWYTYIYHLKADSMDIYRKERDASNPFKQIIAGIARTSNSSPAQFQPYCAKGMDACIDNVMLYNGTFTTNASFEIDGNEVSSIDDVTAGTLKATATVVTSMVTAEKTDDGVIASEGAVTKPLIVAYNKNHKMVYSMVADDAKLIVGENKFEFSVDTSSFAHKLKGGYIGFYIWDDFGNLEPLMDAIELK